MMAGSYKGKRIGACTDCRNNWTAFRAGSLDVEDIASLNEELAPTVSPLQLNTRKCQLMNQRLEYTE